MKQERRNYLGGNMKRSLKMYKEEEMEREIINKERGILNNKKDLITRG